MRLKKSVRKFLPKLDDGDKTCVYPDFTTFKTAFAVFSAILFLNTTLFNTITFETPLTAAVVFPSSPTFSPAKNTLTYNVITS